MKKSYNFKKSTPNPYIQPTKQQITIRLDQESIQYFKNLAQETGITYQNLIDLFLKDCARKKRKPSVKWL